MKRINQKTGEPFKRGDVGEDGRIFWAYHGAIKLNGQNREWWVSSEKFSELQKSHRSKTQIYAAKDRAKNVQRTLEYFRRNPGVDAARVAKRKADRLKRTPQWLDSFQLEQIKQYYKKAQSITENTGVKHHVDHIVPLRGKTVSGLHVPWNLQIITAIENGIKHNKF
jgi:hypothetical protein